MTRFTAIDLSRLPALPRTALTFEQIYAAYIADLAARLNLVGIPYNVGALQTDTYAITGQAFAYRVESIETSIDDAIAAVLLPSSYDAYLDQLGLTQDPPVQRNVLVPAQGATPAVLEGDDPFRARIQLAPEALSTCGPEGAYLFFAIGVPDVASAAVYGPMSFGGTPANPFTPLGEVHVPILALGLASAQTTAGVGDGTAPAAMVAAVQAALSAEDRRPIADFVTVTAATVVAFTLDATLAVGSGADSGTVLTAAYARVRAVADLAHRPGGQVLDQDLFAALKVPDALGAPIVGKVTLNGWADVNPVDPAPGAIASAYVAPFCVGLPVGIAPALDTIDDGAGGSLFRLTAGDIVLKVVVIDD